MATFDDSDDIKISTTLDTEGAIKAAQDLKTSIENAIKATATQFDKLQQASKQLGTVLKAQSEKEVSQTKQKLDQVVNATSNAAQQEVAIAQQTADQKVAVVEKAIKRTISAEQRRIQELKVAAKQEMELEKTKRTQILKDIAELNLKRAVVRKTPRSELPEELGGVSASAKILKQLEGIAVSVGNRFGFLTVNLTQAYNVLSSFGTLGKVFAGITAGATASAFGISKITSEAFRLSDAAGKLEGLVNGFETLQRSVGRLPTESIEKLRVATQGLISDTELYQRANQAVLLQVPTKLFEESAEAAVKLGRAMGIDAAFALESLSIGLGRQSRLYLDNLGIVVSASEAYRNFAAENNKLVSELTESDKRLAFFNQTSKELKEALATLPPIQRTVGVEFERLTASAQNLNAEFLKGFNQNKNLANTYSDLNTEVGKLEIAFKNFGDVYASVVSIILNNPISKGVVGTAVSVVNEISANLAAKFGQGYEQVLARARQDLNAAEMDLNEFDKGRTSKLQQALGFDREVYQNRVNAARLTVENIINEQKRLEALPPVGIKTDTQELDNFASDFTALVENLKEKIGEDLGVIRIRGVEQGQVDETIKQVANLGEQIARNEITAKDAQTAIANYANSLAEGVRAIELKDIEDKIVKLDKTSKDYKQNLAQLTAEQKALENTLAPSAKAQERINKALEVGLKQGRERVSQSKATTSALKKEQNQIDSLRKQFETFGKKTRQSLEEAIPVEIQKDLLNLFRTAGLTTQQFSRALGELAIKANASGADLDILKDTVADLQDQINKGVEPLELKINAPGAATQQVDDELKQIQSQMLNIRKLFTDQEGGGGFFGFDIGESFDAKQEAALAQGIGDAAQLGLNLGFQEFTRDDAPELGQQIGTTLGAAIGGAIGGPAGAQIGAQIGGPLGQIVGEVIKRSTQDLAGTKERKKIDAYFSELFDGGRLAVVIQGQLTGAINEATGEAIREAQPQLQRISSLVFEGFTPFAGNVSFGGEGFTNYFNTLSTSVQASFNGVGLALGKLQGFATEQAKLIGVALANNIGGSLQNLQVLVQATGESFDDLANAILEAFLNSEISIDEAYNSLVQLQNIYGEGIPGAIGAYQEAIDNLNNSLRDDAPGRYAIDSLRDIGAEGQEAGKTFQAVISSLAQTFNFTAEQQARLFEALKINGINSLAELQKASNEQLLAILKNIKIIKDNATAPLVTTPQVSFESKPPAPRSSGSRGKSPEQIAREKLREETKKLLRESIAYLDVLKKITDGEISRAQAGAEIVKLQTEIEEALKRRNRLEKALEEELDKGRKANKKRLADLASQLDAVNEKIDGFTKKAGESTKQFKQLNISGVIPFIKSANTLGVIAKQVGVSFEKATDILIQGFLKGRLSLAELNKELKSTRETLGPGIPNAVGAVTDAFQNLIDAGTQGGQFSVDAFTDIFAEYREKFQTENSALREAERKQLNENLTVAREAFANAVGPEATAAAKKTLDEAKKALDDFYAAAPAPDLAGLRSELERQFGADQVNLFFQALDESGLKTFEDFEKAGVDSIVGILGKLQSIGFQFNKTSEEILKANEELNNAEQAANGGLDPLQEAINLIKGLNEGAGQLPPVFNSTTKAVEGLNGPLAALKTGFDDIIEKLGLLSGQTYENDVVFNVRTVGDTGSKALVEIIFGDGANTTKDVAPTTPGNAKSGASQIAEWKAEIRRIQKLPSTERRRKELKRLRNLIAEAGG